MSFLTEFDQRYAHLLHARVESFRCLFRELEERAKSRKHLHLVETGCLRTPGNWRGDGQSSFLFDRFLHHYPESELDIFDLSPASIRSCRGLVFHPNTRLHCMDSVAGLWRIKGPVDMVYLDSFDVDFNDTHPSALHHLKELASIMKNLVPQALVMVDDNVDGTGKGQYVARFMKDIGAKCLHDGYQILFRLP